MWGFLIKDIKRSGLEYRNVLSYAWFVFIGNNTSTKWIGIYTSIEFSNFPCANNRNMYIYTYLNKQQKNKTKNTSKKKENDEYHIISSY